MKIALLSDTHLTVTTPIGRKDDIEVTMIAGDLTDVKRSWELLSYLTTLFGEWKRKGIIVCSVFGQHDSYYHEVQNETTVLGILIKSGLVTRLGKKRAFTGENYKKGIAIYGCSWGEDIPQGGDSTINILVIHKMIAMRKMWAKQTDLTYAPDFLRAHGEYSLILCGDAHQQFIHTDKNDGRIICNTGPLLRLEASKEMMRHRPKIMIYDTDRNTIQQIVLKCSDEVFTRDHIKSIKQDREEFDDFINEILDQGVSRYSFETILRKYLEGLEKEGSVPNKGVRKILSEVMADE
jgi:predicted phosphodiesterase